MTIVRGKTQLDIDGACTAMKEQENNKDSDDNSISLSLAVNKLGSRGSYRPAGIFRCHRIKTNTKKFTPSVSESSSLFFANDVMAPIFGIRTSQAHRSKAETESF